MMKILRDQAAFTLIELMITVAIVAILASIAMPKYQLFQAKAKTAEATNNLAAIRALEETYRAEYDAYLSCASTPTAVPVGVTAAWTGGGASDFRKLGFLPDGEVRYQYKVTTSGFNYTATAVGDVDADGVQATYTLTNAIPRPVLTTPGVF